MRVKRGTVTKARHKKLLKQNKGYRMTKSRLIRVAKEASLHAGQYAYQGRKKRKSEFRSVWISKITQFLKNEGIAYSSFINKLKKNNIIIDRKVLSYMIDNDQDAFKYILHKIK